MFHASVMATVLDTSGDAFAAPKRLVPRPEQQVMSDIIDLRRSEQRKVKLITLKARAVGGSLWSEWDFYHDAMWNPHTRCLTLAHLNESVTPLQEYILRFMQSPGSDVHGHVTADGHRDLPDDWLAPFQVKPKDGIFYFPNGSRWRFGTSGSPDQLKSDRATRALFTEVASYDQRGNPTKVQRLFEAIDGAIPQHWNTTEIWESTSSGPYGRFYDTFTAAMEGRNDFDWVFFSFANSPLYAFESSAADLEHDARLKIAWRMGKTDEIRIAASCLGYTDEWVTMACEHNLTPGQVHWAQAKVKTEYTVENVPRLDLFLRNYPISPQTAFNATKRHFFPEVVMRSWRETPLPDSTVMGKFLVQMDDAAKTVKLIPGTPYWHIYHAPEPGHTYTIGSDVSMGVGRDNSTVCVLDRTTRCQVAEFYANDVAPDLLGEQINIARQWYNDAFIIPENVPESHATILRLIQLGASRNLYRNAQGPANIVHADQWTSMYGFRTKQRRERNLLLSTLRVEVLQGLHVYSPRLRLEAQRFVETDVGDWDHAKGAHDDAIFALALAVWGHCELPAVRTTVQQHVAEESPIMAPFAHRPLAVAPKRKRMARFR